MLVKCEVCLKEEAIAVIINSNDYLDQYHIGTKCLKEGRISLMGINDCIIQSSLGFFRVQIQKMEEEIGEKDKFTLVVRNWFIDKGVKTLFDLFDKREKIHILRSRCSLVEGEIFVYRPIFGSGGILCEEVRITCTRC